MTDTNFQIFRMRRILDTPFNAPSWPLNVYLTELTPNTAREVHDLLILGYQNGEGMVGPFSEWWPNLLSDSEFDPSLCFLAHDDEGIVGVAQCWTSAFVKDLVVHPRRRHQGIAASLLLHVFSIFKERGAVTVDLKVNERNISAIKLYFKLGMHII